VELSGVVNDGLQLPKRNGSINATESKTSGRLIVSWVKDGITIIDDVIKID
jgi:hypothetical protein